MNNRTDKSNRINKIDDLNRWRIGLGLVAAVTLTSGAALATFQPAAATPVVVPPGCGSYSGNALPAGWTLDDFSGGGAVGTASKPYVVPATANVITVGSRFADYIDGNEVDEVICGGNGGDIISGNGGDDEIHGDNGPDVLMGEEDSDFVGGGGDKDYVYGDDDTDSSGNLDFDDTLQGGDNADHLFGGAGEDDIAGGNGKNDVGDGETDGGTCDVAVETQTNC